MTIEKAIQFFNNECIASKQEIEEIKQLSIKALKIMDSFKTKNRSVFKYMKDHPYEDKEYFYTYLTEIENEMDNL